jgi:hypothetical protein
MSIPHPADGIQVAPGLWLAWLIDRHSLDAQAWLLNLATAGATSGCACPGCAPHEQAGRASVNLPPRRCHFEVTP